MPSDDDAPLERNNYEAKKEVKSKDNVHIYPRTHRHTKHTAPTS